MYPPQPHQQQQQQQVRIAETGVLYTAAGQPVAITSPMNASTYESYCSRQSLIVGIILIITRALSIIFNGVAIGFFEVYSFIGQGIWCGIMFIIAGSFGVAAAKKSRCVVIASMVLDIISASLAPIMFILSVVGALVGNVRYPYEYSPGVMCAVMALLAVIAGVTAIWGSVLGCKVICCGRQTTPVVLGSNQPVVIFAQQPQQPYFSVPQADPLIATNPGAPPAYTSSSGYPMTSGQQQQSMTSSAGYYTSPPYNPAVIPPPAGAFGPPPPSVHDHMPPPSK